MIIVSKTPPLKNLYLKECVSELFPNTTIDFDDELKHLSYYAYKDNLLKKILYSSPVDYRKHSHEWFSFILGVLKCEGNHLKRLEKIQKLIYELSFFEHKILVWIPDRNYLVLNSKAWINKKNLLEKLLVLCKEHFEEELKKFEKIKKYKNKFVLLHLNIYLYSRPKNIESFLASFIGNR